VSAQLLRVLAAHAGEARDADALRALADRGAYVAQVRDRYVRLADLLARFPSVSLPLDRLLAVLPPLLPRYYSISSSPKAVPARELHVTFRHLRVARDDGTVFDGLASTYLARRGAGDLVRVAVRPSSFRLPADPATPVVMVAGGIGIAPFRAFIQDRMADLASGRVRAGGFGPATVLYGCRDARDEVYRGLMQDALAAGALTGFGIAHAGGAPPKLAHHLLQEHAATIAAALQGGGNVYVCGGATGFGQAVARTVRDIAKSAGRLDEAGADAYMKALLDGCRFVEDLAD
jgi:sulfite reductase alpha subunit-like flavoprotein